MTISGTDSPRNVDKYVGPDYSFVPRYIRKRDPQTLVLNTDIRPKENQGYYPIGSFWLNVSNSNVWLLANIVTVTQSGVTGPAPDWVLISTSHVLGIKFVVPNGPSPVSPTNTGIVNFTSNDSTVTITGVTTVTGTNTIDFSAPNASPGIEEVTLDDLNTVTGTGSPSNLTFNTEAISNTNSYATALETYQVSAHVMGLRTQYAGSNPATSTTDNWGVAQFDSNSFGVASGFVTLKNGGTTGAVTNIQGDDSALVVPSSGTITFNGDVVANATNAQAVYFKKNSTSAEYLQVQKAAAIASTNVANVGLAAFSSAQFQVDGNGFVQLAGGTTQGILTITTSDANNSGPTSGGVFNVLGTGSITTIGTTYTATVELTGLTAHNVLVGAGSPTITNVAPSATSGVPLISQGSSTDPIFGTAVVAGGGTGNTTFTAYSVICAGTTATGAFQDVSGVGTSGQVLTSNGAGALPTWQTSSASGAVTQVTLDVATTPISPSAGNITLTGGQVATGTVGANVIRTRGNTASSATIEIQRTTTAASENSTLNGVSHFNSSQFSVTSGGFVSISPPPSTFPWTDEAASFNASSNNGYFITAGSVIATLPASPNQGDVIRFAVDTTSSFTVTANAAQAIRLGNVVSASAGTAASSKRGDTINLIFRSSDKIWLAMSSVGSWTII